MTETKIEKDVSLDRIRPSKTNPRTHFDEKALEELTDSVAVHGILQPLLARPDWCMGKSTAEISKINGQAPAPQFFEIVAGERRYRAAVKAKVDKATLNVGYFSDQDALEIQLIENLQRADLDAFEEAAGYRKLLDLRDAAGKPVHTVQTIHERTGKSTPRIYQRLKLLNVSPTMRRAVRNGLSVIIAEAVGAIPTKEMRDAATSEILKPTDPQYGVGPMSVREATEFIEGNFMRSLSGAQFDQTDANLVAVIQDEQTGERIGGGACTDCPKRTGNMEALIGKTKRPDVCTNPQCFALKTNAYFARLQESAAAEGKKILTAEEAREIFDAEGHIYFDSEYVKLSDQPDRHEVRSDFSSKIPSWKKLIEGLASKPQIFIAMDPRGRVVELVVRALAMEAINLAAKQKGEKSIFDNSPAARTTTTSSGGGLGSGSSSSGVSDQDKKNREIAKQNFQITLASMSAVIAAIDDKGPLKGFWDALIKAAITHAGYDGCWLICKRHGLDPKIGKRVVGFANEGVEGAALEYGLTLPDEKMKFGYVVELLISQRVKFSQQLGGLRSVETFTMFAKLYGVDLAAIEKKVRSESKEEKKTGNGKPDTGKMHWLRKPEGEFKFNSNGVCAKPATLVLAFPKTSRVRVHLMVSRHATGFVSGSDVEKEGVGTGCFGCSGLPSRTGTIFPTIREALLHEAEEALKQLKASEHMVAASAQEMMSNYVEQIKAMVEVVSANSSDAGKSKLTRVAAADHDFEKVTGNKYRCKGCGAAAVKHHGKLLVAKEFRGKPCSQSEAKPETGNRKPDRKKKSKLKKKAVKSGKSAIRNPKSKMSKGGVK